MTLADELDAQAEKATPGPWEISETGASIVSRRGRFTSRLIFGHDGSPERRKRDYELISSLRNAIPEIIAALRAQEKNNAE